MFSNDATSAGFGVLGWAVAVPVVRLAGEISKSHGDSAKWGVLGLGFSISLFTTPLGGSLLGWKTQDSRIRGIAIALGTAQMIDGVVHMFYPDFYSADPTEARASSAAIFFGAGCLGVLSCFT